MLEPAGSFAHRDAAECTGMTEQHGVLRVTVLSIAGGAEADQPPIGTYQSQLYCTCEIPGKPHSRSETARQGWRPSESGFCLQNQCWKVEWNTTFEIQDFRRDDFLAFAVWAKEHSEHEMKDGVDRLLGRTVMTSRSCSALGTKPGSLNQSHSLESDLPLAGTGTDSLAILAIRVSLDLPSEIEKAPHRQVSPQKPLEPLMHRKTSSVDSVSDSASSRGNQVRSSGIDRGFDRQDTDAPSCDGLSDLCHLATVRRALQTELEVHAASWHRKILSALQESENRMTKTMYFLMGDRAPVQSMPSNKGRRRSKDYETLSLSAQENLSLPSDGFGGLTRASSKTRTEMLAEVEPPKITHSRSGVVQERRISVMTNATNNGMQTGLVTNPDAANSEDVVKRKSEARKGGRMPKDKFVSMAHMDFTHTNLILQAEGLVSGPPSPPKETTKTRRRPSITDMFGLGPSGATDDAQPSNQEAASSTERKYKPERSSCTERRSHRTNTRDGNRKRTLEEARSSLEESLKAISAEATPSRRSRSDSRKSTADKSILQKLSSVKAEVLQPIPSVDNSGKAKLRRAKGKLRFVLAMKNASRENSRYASEATSVAPDAEPSPDVSAAFQNLDLEAQTEGFASEESLPQSAASFALKEVPETAASASPLLLPVHLPGGIGDGSSSQTVKRPETTNEFVKDQELEHDLAKANIESQPTTIPHSTHEETPPASNCSSGESDHDEVSEASTQENLIPESEQQVNPTGSRLLMGLMPHSHHASSTAATRESRRGSSFCATQSMQLLRRGHEETLLGRASEYPEASMQLNFSDKAVKLSMLPTFVMNFSAITPLESCASDLYLGLVLFLALASSLCSTRLVTGEDGSPYDGSTSTILAAGSFVGLVSIRRTNKLQFLLGPAALPLERYAINHHFLEEWMMKSRQRFKWLTVAWVGAVLLYSLLPLVGHTARCEETDSVYYDADSTKWQAVLGPTTAFAYSSGLFLTLLYCQFHIVCFLELMLDSFCRRLFEAEVLEEMVSEWNVRQAILRHAARTIENCFVVVQTCAFCSLVLAVFSVWSDARRACGIEWVMLALEHIPVLIVAMVALLLFCNAASVTEQCARVPSLVNSISLENPVDEIRQYVVAYILNSDAGFYVRDVRLTAAMALKITYVVGAAGIGMLVHVFRM